MHRRLPLADTLYAGSSSLGTAALPRQLWRWSWNSGLFLYSFIGIHRAPYTIEST
jgi:hypothetical protein